MYRAVAVGDSIGSKEEIVELHMERLAIEKALDNYSDISTCKQVNINSCEWHIDETKHSTLIIPIKLLRAPNTIAFI